MAIATSAPAVMSFFEPQYLLDTDWVAHYLRGKRHDIVARLQELAPQGLALSSIALAELYHGVYLSQRKEENLKGLRDFLANIMVLNVDAHIAERFGQEKTSLQMKGTPIDNFDLLIGCTALEYNLVLLTNNRKHYERIEKLCIESL
ncbi:MAG: type II toxin-antitoxin system VapC family toxin [bacterium]|nr:type II toxin-antitoxin system VapC family toxin [bacterium]